MMYEIKYLPMALNDVREIIDYITDVLNAPQAAVDLAIDLENSISRLERFPYSCMVYRHAGFLSYEYRYLQVKNYLVFYAVTEQFVEIHRVVYAKVDLSRAVK
jgi:plasmid stabilization system protein ParE